MPLTKRDVDKLSWNPQGPAMQIVYDEGGLPGFGVRLFASGAKSYCVWYRTKSGTKRLFTVGKHGVFTVQQAREKARGTLASVAAGQDPMDTRQEAREGETLREFAAVYLEQYAKKHTKTWRETERRLNSRILPVLGSKRLKDISADDVERLHTKIGATHPIEANRIIEVISSVFTRATEKAFKRLPPDHVNPARITHYKETARERWATDEELPHLIAAISEEDNPFVRAALRLYLLTGMRKTELLERTWADVDFSRRELRLGVTKNGKTHTVPLSDQAVAELRALPKHLGKFIFPSPVKPGARLLNISKPWRRVRGRVWIAMHPQEAVALRAEAEAYLRRKKHAPKNLATLESHVLVLAAKKAGEGDSLRLHDLRRTAGSMMLNAGVPVEAIAEVLNNPSAVRVYARMKKSAARTALEAHGNALGALLNARSA
jgi:integrase